MSRILLLEDDTMIASGILYALETEGYETNHATGIKDAGSLIEHYNFDLAIIDMPSQLYFHHPQLSGKSQM